jgi:hypothetical protein
MNLEPEVIAFEIAFGAFVLAHAVVFAVRVFCEAHDEIKRRISETFGKK